MLINTSRGAVVDTRAVIAGLKSGRIGALGLDVYEEEGDLFFRDLSETMLQDDVFARLLTFPNVLITGPPGRSEERRVGQDCVSKCSSRWSAYPYKNNHVFHELVVLKQRRLH